MLWERDSLLQYRRHHQLLGGCIQGDDRPCGGVESDCHLIARFRVIVENQIQNAPVGLICRRSGVVVIFRKRLRPANLQSFQS
jgi:hypothetical protein